MGSILKNSSPSINFRRLPLLDHKRACSQFQYQRKSRNFDNEFQKDYGILELNPSADQSQVRDSFIKLAKKYHPDSGLKTANNEKFQKINQAYKNLLRKFADERHNLHKYEGQYGLYYDQKKAPTKPQQQKVEVETPDIKHTAPQHRQYLNNDGIGFGTPAQRESQYQKYRVHKATNNLMEHRVKKIALESNQEETALVKDQREVKKIKTRYGIERLVEDLIQESIAKGEFKNLKGEGKPLEDKKSINPHLDFTTHKLNQMLIDNGFIPEWILLEKELRQEIGNFRKKLLYHRHKYDQILSKSDEVEWEKYLTSQQPTCDDINKSIFKYNLIVPILQKQMVNLDIERESKKCLANFSIELQQLYKNDKIKRDHHGSTSSHQSAALDPNQDSFLGLIFSIFHK